MWALTCICRVRNHALLIIHEWLLMQKKQIFEFKCHSLASQDGFVKELLFLSVLICHRIMFTLMILTVDDTWALPSVGSSYFTSPNPNHQPPPAFFSVFTTTQEDISLLLHIFYKLDSSFTPQPSPALPNTPWFILPMIYDLSECREYCRQPRYSFIHVGILQIK